MDFSTRQANPGIDPFDSSVWARGFQLGSTGGMVCDICACLVRQDPSSAKRHLAWHEQAG